MQDEFFDEEREGVRNVQVLHNAMMSYFKAHMHGKKGKGTMMQQRVAQQFRTIELVLSCTEYFSEAFFSISATCRSVHCSEIYSKWKR